MDKIRGIIFDLDGTLIDSIEDIGDSLNRTLNKLGLREYSKEDYKQMVGGGFRNLVEKAVASNVDQVLEGFQLEYSRGYLNKTKPYEGIINLLDQLVERKILIAINTNKYEEFIGSIVDKYFSDYNFVDIIGFNERIELKPSPMGAEIILDKMGLRREEILYVGDSSVDIETAKNAGLKSVGVDWGFRGKEELESFGADYIALEPSDILNLLG